MLCNIFLVPQFEDKNFFYCLQCRIVKITVLGDEGVPVQVDGEAWVQPPGFIYVIHKNRAQMLTRDKVSLYLSFYLLSKFRL